MAKGVKRIEDLDSSPRSTKYTKTMEELTAARAAAKERHIAHEKEQEAREQKKSERVRKAGERTTREKERRAAVKCTAKGQRIAEGQESTIKEANTKR